MLGTAIGHLRHEDVLAPRHLEADVRALQAVDHVVPLECVRSQHHGGSVLSVAGVAARGGI